MAAPLSREIMCVVLRRPPNRFLKLHPHLPNQWLVEVDDRFRFVLELFSADQLRFQRRSWLCRRAAGDFRRAASLEVCAAIQRLKRVDHCCHLTCWFNQQ